GDRVARGAGTRAAAAVLLSAALCLLSAALYLLSAALCEKVADLFEEERAELERFLLADAFDERDFVLRARPPRREQRQRAVVEDQVGRHAAFARELAAERAQVFEQRFTELVEHFPGRRCARARLRAARCTACRGLGRGVRDEELDVALATQH